MKFGIDIPGTVEESVILDEANGNTLWQDAIKLEMNNSRVDFKLCEKGEKAPVGHTKITCHIIFYLRLDMTLKARYQLIALTVRSEERRVSAISW